MWDSLQADVRLYGGLRYPGLSTWKRFIGPFFSRGLLVLVFVRLSRLVRDRRREYGWGPVTLFLRICLSLMHPLVIGLAKADVTINTDLADGIYLSDRGHMVIGAERIGAGTMIHHRVTIGMSLLDEGKPTIGTNVWIGPDCVISGDIVIGDGATILPGTVLTKSIPPETIVGGNPARLTQPAFDVGLLRTSLVFDLAALTVTPAVRD